MKITLRLFANRRLTRLAPNFTAGQYSLTSLPSAGTKSQEFMLVFDDVYSAKSSHSHPQMEGEFISEMLGLMFDVYFEVVGYAIDETDCSDMMCRPEEERLSEIENIEADMELCLNGIARCQEKIARQFIRSVHAYSLALRCIKVDTALALVLLVTAVEALSSQTDIIPAVDSREKDSKKADRFCNFIESYCGSDYLSDGHLETSVREDLKTIYYVSRSGFLHGGVELSLGSSAADRSGSRSFPVIIDGKEKFIPGIQWFRKVVRSSMLMFMRKFPHPEVKPDNELLARIASERGRMHISEARFAWPSQEEVSS